MRRADVPVSQERLDELSLVRGWIEPVFTHTDPATGHTKTLIRQEDGERIAQGYACGNSKCGAIFDMILPRCAVCHQPIALQLEEALPEWGQHLRDRASGYAPPIAPASVDDFLADVMADPDIEQIRLK